MKFKFKFKKKKKDFKTLNLYFRKVTLLEMYHELPLHVNKARDYEIKSNE